MTDLLDFETRLEERIRARAAVASRPFDAASIAHQVVVDRQPRRFGTLEWRSIRPGLRLLAVGLLLAMAVLGTVTGVGSLMRERPVLPASGVANGVIVYATQSGLSPVYVVRPGDEPRQIVPSETGVGNTVVCPTFSPDGAMLAVGMPGGSIVVLSIDELGEVGDSRRLPSRAEEVPHCPAWAPDSSAVAYLDGSALEIDPLVGEPRRIEGWEPAGGTDAAAFVVDYPPDRAVQWSPDGTAIAIARPSGTWLMPVDGAPRRLHESPANTVSWSPDGTRLVVWSRSGIVVISARDGVVEASLPSGRQPVWSPRGDRIAYVDDGARIIVIGPDGADPRMVSDYGYNITWSPDGSQIMYIRDVSSSGYALMSQAIDADGNLVGNAVTVVPVVEIASARSFPPAQQFSWQPLPVAVPSESPAASPTASAAGAWVPTTPMTDGRSSHTATLLQDGQVLVAGGDAATALASAELYDPGSGSWTAIETMNDARSQHTATLLPDGRVLVVGGRRENDAIASAELYDPSTGRWTVTTAMVETHGQGHTATLLPDGRVLVVGGSRESEMPAPAELFDPATDSWTRAGTLEAARIYHTATLLPDGTVLIAGSLRSPSSAEIYHPDTGTWTTTGSMKHGRYDFRATLLADGTVLATAWEGGRSAEVYDPSSGTWTEAGSMSDPRLGAYTATLLPDGTVLVVGGVPNDHVRAELYDPRIGTWAAAPDAGTGRQYGTATLLPDGTVLFAGGRGGLASAELYHPSVQP